MEALLPPEISIVAASVLMGVSFIASLITAAFGIGGGVVMIAVLASLLPPAALIPVHAVVQVGSNAGRALIMRAHIDWPIWMVFLAGTVVGVAIGGVLVIDLPPALIQIGIGLFILWTIFLKPPAFLRHSAWLAGGVSSILTMFFGATGPFVSAYLKTRQYDRMTQVAMQGACMTAQHLLKVVAFGVLGFAFGPYIVLIAGLIGFGFLGTVAGRRILMKIDEALFKRVLNGILILLSLRLIWAGASSYL
ncbi:MAG: sulfite exporter TauE/SafE family protein [Pseudomonadota bacterium]